MEFSSLRTSKKKKTGPIIKDMVESTNLYTTQNVSELPIVTHYKKKINELTMNNKALSQALETSHRTIYHQNKVISNLEKKLVSEVPEGVLLKFQAIGTALAHVVDLVEEASILLKNNSQPISAQSDAKSQSAITESIGPCQKKSKRHHKRKKSYKGATNQALPPQLENGICSNSSSDHDSEEVDQIIAQFKSDKNVRHKRKKCKRSTSKRGDNETSQESECLPNSRSQALGEASCSYPAITNTPDTVSSEQDSNSHRLILKMSNKSSNKNRPSRSKPRAYLDSSRAADYHSKNRSHRTIVRKSKSPVKNHHETRKSNRNIYATTSKVSTRTSSRSTSQNGNHSETTNENVRNLRKKQAHINYEDTEDLNFIFDEDDGKGDSSVSDTSVDLGANVKIEPVEVIDNVKIPDIQSITSNVSLLQPKILVRDIFLDSDSDCESVILKSKHKYLSQKDNEGKTVINDNENAEPSLKIKKETIIETDMATLEGEEKVIPQNGNDSSLNVFVNTFSDTNAILNFPSLNPSMNGTTSESKTSIDGKEPPNVAVKKGSFVESTEDFSNSSGDDLNWKEVFECILKD